MHEKKMSDMVSELLAAVAIPTLGEALERLFRFPKSVVLEVVEVDVLGASFYTPTTARIGELLMTSLDAGPNTTTEIASNLLRQAWTKQWIDSLEDDETASRGVASFMSAVQTVVANLYNQARQRRRLGLETWADATTALAQVVAALANDTNLAPMEGRPAPREANEPVSRTVQPQQTSSPVPSGWDNLKNQAPEPCSGIRLGPPVIEPPEGEDDSNEDHDHDR